MAAFMSLFMNNSNDEKGIFGCVTEERRQNCFGVTNGNVLFRRSKNKKFHYFLCTYLVSVIFTFFAIETFYIESRDKVFCGLEKSPGAAAYIIWLKYFP